MTVVPGQMHSYETARASLSAAGRRSDLQGMRALAVLAVFADHLFRWPSGGFVGVDVFFVLSGFFISGLLIRERTTRGKVSFQGFYVRRVKRILPSAILVLVTTATASSILFPAVRAKETLIDALYAAVFAANFRFEAVGADYFQEGQPPSPIQHYWSLSIEEQFYFVWPVLLVAVFAITRRLRYSGKGWARKWGLFGSMALIVIASFGWAVYLSAADPNAAYFSTLTRVWELGVGALVAIAGPWLSRIPTRMRPVLAYLGLAGVFVSFFIINPSVQFPAPWAALPVLSTSVVVASFHGAEVHGMFPLTNRVARYLGDRSYTLYLWHWPVIVLLISILPKGPLFYGIALGLPLMLTALTYRYYENPIRKSGWLLDVPSDKSGRWPKISRSTSALIGGLIVGVIIVSILGLQLNNQAANTAQTDQRYVVDLRATPPKIDPCFGAPAMLTKGCTQRDSSVPLQPSIDDFANDTQGGYQCFRNKGEALKSCTYGFQGTGAKRIALVGDSHAASLVPALWPYLITNKWQLTTYIGWGCQWQDPVDGECPMPEIESKLLAQPYDLVVTTSSRKTGGDGAGAAAAYQRAWGPVAAAGSRIAVVADNPGVSEDSLACLTRVSLGGDKTGDCGTPTAVAFTRPDPLVAAAALVPQSTLIDLTRFYCTPDSCPAVIGNVIVYRDTGGHFTATYVKTLGPVLDDQLKRAMGSSRSAGN